MGAAPAADREIAASPADPAPRYWFLTNLTPADLDPTDWQLLRQNVLLALYELLDEESVTWLHPDSERSGTVRVLATQNSPGMMCRDLRTSIDMDDASDISFYRFCRLGEGFWLLKDVVTPAPTAAGP